MGYLCPLSYLLVCFTSSHFLYNFFQRSKFQLTYFHYCLCVSNLINSYFCPLFTSDFAIYCTLQYILFSQHFNLFVSLVIKRLVKIFTLQICSFLLIVCSSWGYLSFFVSLDILRPYSLERCRYVFQLTNFFYIIK